MKPKILDDAIKVGRGSRNVYADLRFSDPVEMLAKARLVAQIQRILTDRKLTLVAAARMFGIDQSKILMLLRGHFHRFSQARLTGFLMSISRMPK